VVFVAKTSSMYIRIDPQVKADVETIYARYGMSITEAINIFLYTSRNIGGLPFDLRPSIPNAETIAAIKEVQEMKRNPHLCKSFDSVEALFEDLNNDD
jgi:DNA-damage-inducible protein J